MNIKRMISKYNFSPRNGKKITHIVIHDVGMASTAYSNAIYFNGGNRNVSAHYFVDDEDIFQVVEDWNAAWHAKQYNPFSIGIEMCLPTGVVTEATEQRTVTLVKMLMAKHKVPVENVVRHFDATGKTCPKSFSANNWARWHTFKNKLRSEPVNTLEPGTYILRCRANPKYVLDMYKDTGKLILYPEHGGLNQQWQYNPDGTFTCVHNGLAIDVERGSTAKGASLIVYGRHGGLNQQFVYTEEGIIVNRGSGLCLDVKDGKVVGEQPIIQWTVHGGLNQRWDVIKVG